MREIMRFFQFILSYYTRSKENKDLFYTLTEIFGTSINPIRPCGVGGGRGGGVECPRRFQLSRTSSIFKQYLPNVATFTKIY